MADTTSRNIFSQGPVLRCLSVSWKGQLRITVGGTGREPGVRKVIDLNDTCWETTGKWRGDQVTGACTWEEREGRIRRGDGRTRGRGQHEREERGYLSSTLPDEYPFTH